MRKLIVAAALAALLSPAEAQQNRQRGQKPAASTPQQAPQPSAPPFFPCRTAEETCFLGIVTGNNEIIVVFTNAPQADEMEARPVAVLTGDSPAAAGSATRMDLAPHLGRVVMLTGAYDPQAGLTKAELVEVASPLVSLLVKGQLAIEEATAEASKPQPQAKPRR